jgi:hypothetical protein
VGFALRPFSLLLSIVVGHETAPPHPLNVIWRMRETLRPFWRGLWHTTTREPSMCASPLCRCDYSAAQQGPLGGLGSQQAFHGESNRNRVKRSYARDTRSSINAQVPVEQSLSHPCSGGLLRRRCCYNDSKGLSEVALLPASFIGCVPSPLGQTSTQPCLGESYV